MRENGSRLTSRWIRTTLAALPLVAMLVLWGQASAQDSAAQQDAPPRVSVTVREGRVTVSAQDAPLREVLTDFSRASGVQIYLEASVAADEPTTIAFDSVPTEEGLRRLLRAKNFLLVYAAGGLAEVRIYTDGRGEFQKLATDKAASRAAARNRSPLGPESGAGNVAKAPPERQPANPTPPPPEPTVTELRAKALGNPDPEQRVAGLDEL